MWNVDRWGARKERLKGEVTDLVQHKSVTGCMAVRSVQTSAKPGPLVSSPRGVGPLVSVSFNSFCETRG
jgi:hypothetical protein